jgi:hypothetical protein
VKGVAAYHAHVCSYCDLFGQHIASYSPQETDVTCVLAVLSVKAHKKNLQAS